MDIFVQQRQLHNWCDSSLLGGDFLNPWVSLSLSVQLFGHQLLGFWGFSWGVWWWQPHFTNTKHVDIVRVGWAMVGDSAWLRVTSRDFEWLFLWMYAKFSLHFYECTQKMSTFTESRVTPRDSAWLCVTSRDFAWLRNIYVHFWASTLFFVLLCFFQTI